MTIGTKQERFVIRKTPADPAKTEYFQPFTLEYDITNVGTDDVFVDSITLQLSSDMDTAANYVDQPCAFPLVPNASKRVAVTVTPAPMYQENTNQIKIRCDYRLESDGRVGPLLNETYAGFYLIISAPALTLGDVFISFKQPEDQRLANILERYAKRAGFTPHLLVRTPNVGADQWQTIESLIRQSHSAFVIWARRTDWGDGVEREVALCRQHKVREILIIENGVDVPSAYSQTSVMYKRFDPQEPAAALSEVVSSLRAQIVALRT
jgi:hypothetical protein